MKIVLLLIMSLFVKVLTAQVIPFYSEANNKYGYKDSAGNVVVPPGYDLAYAPEEGMAAFRINGKYGYVDQHGKESIPPKYDHTWKFIGGYAAVKLDGKYGFIDKTGREVIPLIYEAGYNYHGACCYKGLAHVKQYGKWKIIKIGGPG